ncbi:MAG: ferrous iron transport protein B [Crenarchaeota archaeon]|nr:ferrous iron transport protein B [Thermoproteota archaeon]
MLELSNSWEKLRKCKRIAALAGQPNVGKSTLFTRITGEIAHVGNFPGTTVEISVGIAHVDGDEICVIDLPGTYGLSASTEEERVAKRILLSGLPQVTIVVVDGISIERTLYLAIQILEMFPRVVVALNKWDVLHKKGVHINIEKLARYLGSPVIPVSAITGEGVRALLLEALKEMNRVPRKPLEVDYGPLERFVRELEDVVSKLNLYPSASPRWIAIAILEGDEDVANDLRRASENLYREVIAIVERARKELGANLPEVIARQRYALAERIVRDCVVRVEVKESAFPAIDRAFLNPVIGPILSVALLATVFFAVFSINTGYPLVLILRHVGASSAAEALESYSLSGLVGEAFRILSAYTASSLKHVCGSACSNLIAYGVVGGVGVVVSFLPLVFTIMVVLAALEDSGLGPRMASSLHSLFSAFGLSGRAVYPMLTAFGCNVPAVLASRAAIDPVERVEIAMSIAFIPCQARLVVLAAFVTFIFSSSPSLQAVAMVSVLLGGVLLYLATAKLVRVLHRASPSPELLLEIPPIHRPSLRVIWWNSWEQTKHFLKKAGVLIFALSVVSWILLHFGSMGYVGDLIERSFAANLGKFLAPLFATIYGLPPSSAWKMGFATIVGFFAKEGILAVFAQLGKGSIAAAIGMNSRQAFAALLFFMYYLPCLATAVVMHQELGSIKKTVAAVAYMIGIALAISAAAYAVLRFL